MNDETGTITNMLSKLAFPDKKSAQVLLWLCQAARRGHLLEEEAFVACSKYWFGSWLSDLAVSLRLIGDSPLL